ncbi:MAG TPA: hypothetical protein VK661_07145 [Planctomycetota bacterium]|nr:hypothetical protein [Planctomycetota bacterium]
MTRAVESNPPARCAERRLLILGRSLLLILGVALLNPPMGASASRAPAASPSLIHLPSWHGSHSTPDFINANLAFLETQPFTGLAVYLMDPSGAVNVTTGIMTDTSMSYEAITGVLAPIAGMNSPQLRENFAYIQTYTPPDVFDDWSIPVANFANLARALKEAGLKGIFFDDEQYFSQWPNYPDGVAYPQTPLSMYQAQTILRGREVMEAMVAEFPEIVVLTMHGPYVSEPSAPVALGFPPLHEYNELQGPFFTGFMEGAGPLTEVVDGGELYALRSPMHFKASYLWRKYDIASPEVDCAFIPADLRPSWPDRVSIAFAIYNQPYYGQPMDPSILMTTLANALRVTDRWTWFYAEGMTFLKPESQGGASQEWVDAIRKALYMVAPRNPVSPPTATVPDGKSSCGLLGVEALIVLGILAVLRRFGGRRRSWKKSLQSVN